MPLLACSLSTHNNISRQTKRQTVKRADIAPLLVKGANSLITKSHVDLEWLCIPL